VGFYYGLAYRLFDLGEWVCFSLLVVSTVGWGCFSFRLVLRRFLVRGSQVRFLISLWFLPIVLGGVFSVGQGQRVLAWGWRDGL